jgi:hypothetical protein
VPCLMLLLVLSLVGGCSIRHGPATSQLAGAWVPASIQVSSPDDSGQLVARKLSENEGVRVAVQSDGTIDFARSPACIYWPPQTYRVRLTRPGDVFNLPSEGTAKPALTLRVVEAEYTASSSHVRLRASAGKHTQDIDYRLDLRLDGDLTFRKAVSPPQIVETWVLRRSVFQSSPSGDEGNGYR